jgi:hypothetical protein
MNNKEAARKDIHLTLHAEQSVFVVADRTMITTVLQNLVNNAIHFTPASGQISIRCSEKNTIAEVNISDTGIGIAPEKQATLFDFDFSQAKTGNSEHGAGLGLVICHEMLIKNGGTIRVDSNPGKGSTFTFSLPVSTRHDHSADHTTVETGASEIAALLNSSNTPVGSAVAGDLKIQVLPLYEEVIQVLSLENVGHLGELIIAAGEKHRYPALTDYGRMLGELIQGHQIDQIIGVLPPFGKFLKKNNIV